MSAFTEQQIKELEKPLNPKWVIKPKDKFGAKGDYIQGWHAINEANRIFGFGEWSHDIVNLEKTDSTLGKDSKGEAQWQVCYTCITKVTVSNQSHVDVGYGSGYAKKIGDAIEGAIKEASTDSLKRTLRHWGNQFGLALYDKERANVGLDLETINEEYEKYAKDSLVILKAAANKGVKALEKALVDLPKSEYKAKFWQNERDALKLKAEEFDNATAK